MQFNEKDLESIIELQRSLATQKGVNPDIVKEIAEEAMTEYITAKQNDVLHLYSNLKLDEWYIEAMQMSVKASTEEVKKEGFTHWQKEPELKLIDNLFNRKLHGENGRYKEHLDEEAFVILEKLPTGRGKITSYGQAHQDTAQRPNIHYFYAIGDYKRLSEAVSSFDKENLTRFTQYAFGWKNEAPLVRAGPIVSTHEPDLFRRMKKLSIYTSEEGVREL